jgi:hypothetical protein
VNEFERPWTGRLVGGVALVALGALWTSDNLGLVDAGEILRWWPALLIVFGLARLTGSGFARNTTIGLLAVLVGTVLLLNRLGVTHVGLGLLIPLGLMALGFQMVRRGGYAPNAARPLSDSSDWFKTFAIMGGITTRSRSQALRGGEASAVLGGVELDLRQAVPAGERVVVDAFAFLGGIDLIVPPNWKLEIEAMPIVGAIQDERAVDAAQEYRATMVLRGAVILGGLVLRDEPGVERVVRVGTTRIRRERRGRVTEVRIGPDGVKVHREDREPGEPRGPEASPPPTEPR